MTFKSFFLTISLLATSMPAFGMAHIGYIARKTGLTGLYKYNNYKPKHTPVNFDRENMVELCNGRKVEGYWASSQNPSEDKYNGRYPFPKPNPKPWPTQHKFLEKLKTIEQKKCIKESYRGLSPSRFEENINVGSGEFIYMNPKTGESISWPEAFRPYYVEKFNVKPSKEFYEFVMNAPTKYWQLVFRLKKALRTSKKALSIKSKPKDSTR